jgi:anti-anti-sigma factor
MSIKIVQSPDILDSFQAIQFTREIENLLKAGVKIILLDLKDVTFLSSSGLMALVALLKAVQSAGCELLIYSWSEQVRMLFEITGLDQVFKLFNSLE